jgi:hypothetical protein
MSDTLAGLTERQILLQILQKVNTMSDTVTVDLTEIGTDLTIIANGLVTLQTASTAALAAKDATIAGLTTQLTAAGTQDDADKATIATLQAADAAAATTLTSTLAPLVTQADTLAQSFPAPVVAPVVAAAG